MKYQQSRFSIGAGSMLNYKQLQVDLVVVKCNAREGKKKIKKVKKSAIRKKKKSKRGEIDILGGEIKYKVICTPEFGVLFAAQDHLPLILSTTS